MGRWTQYDEDSYRLPDGFRRIGYDADTGKYLFQDSYGTVYQGQAGAEYSTMFPVGVRKPKPSTNSSPTSGENLPVPPPKEPRELTSPEILPSELSTTAQLSDDSPRSAASSIKRVRDKFKESVRTTALPKMYNVLINLRRSVTISKQRRDAILGSGQHKESYDDKDTQRPVPSESA